MKILKPFIHDKNSPDFKKYRNSYHTGVDVEVDGDVIALASGMVTDVGRDREGLAVTIQYDGDISLRYMGLRATSLRLGSEVDKGDIVGQTRKELHFEYIKPFPQLGIPEWPVRIGRLTHFKHDPTPIITGQIIIDNSDEWWANVDFHTVEIDKNVYPVIDYMDDRAYLQSMSAT